MCYYAKFGGYVCELCSFGLGGIASRSMVVMELVPVPFTSVWASERLATIFNTARIPSTVGVKGTSRLPVPQMLGVDTWTSTWLPWDLPSGLGRNIAEGAFIAYSIAASVGVVSIPVVGAMQRKVRLCGGRGKVWTRKR